MIPVEDLNLPPQTIGVIQQAGFRTVESLCQHNIAEVRRSTGICRIDELRQLRRACRKFGWDLRPLHEDPPGNEHLPSATAMRSLMDRMNLAPPSRTALKLFLMGALLQGETLERCHESDRSKIASILSLMTACE
jgi:hypothetical protein